MSNNLTEQEFSKHIGTQFKVALAESALSLTLAEVKAYTPGENEQDGMERFSVVFHGPGEIFLPQKTYQLQHDKMGNIDLFVVPIGGDRTGFRYEAVFNYHKEK